MINLLNITGAFTGAAVMLLTIYLSGSAAVISVKKNRSH